MTTLEDRVTKLEILVEDLRVKHNRFVIEEGGAERVTAPSGRKHFDRSAATIEEMDDPNFVDNILRGEN